MYAWQPDVGDMAVRLWKQRIVGCRGWRFAIAGRLGMFEQRRALFARVRALIRHDM